MTDHQCQSCDNPAPQGVSICSRCETQTRYHLVDQEAHRQELMVALTRQTRMQALNDGGRATNLALAWARMGDRFLDTIDGRELTRILNSLPPARRAADVLHSQRATLVAWCRLLLDEFPKTQAIGPICEDFCAHGSCWAMRWRKGPRDSIASMSMFLHDHMPILRKHDAAGEFVAEIRAIVAQIMRVIDSPATRTRIVVGLCPLELAGEEGPEECPGRIEAIVPADDTIRPVMRCLACSTEWYPEQWARTGALILKRTERKAS